ncbi:hypothetical protein MKW92_025657 [Papaver armeniacum]|nr:hypothetical protein MKW92_025657 [Papaver armeniacum]
MLLLLLLLLNPLIRNSVLQLLVSNEKHYLRNSMEEFPWSGNIDQEQTVFNSLANAAVVPWSSITSATVPALSPTGRQGCTFSL